MLNYLLMCDILLICFQFLSFTECMGIEKFEERTILVWYRLHQKNFR
jgi:hypothetical protein